MKLDLNDLYERGTLTMQMEDIVDTLSLWQAIRLYLFCRQTRSKHRSMFGVDWTRSEAHFGCCGGKLNCDGSEPETVHCMDCGDKPEHCPEDCVVRQLA